MDTVSTWVLHAARMVDLMAMREHNRNSRPGPHLKNRVGTGPTHFGTRHGAYIVLDSGAVYEPRRDGWRRRRDIEAERIQNESISV